MRTIKKTSKREDNVKSSGQVVLEFTMCVFVILLMLYALVAIWKWTGVDLVERRLAHEALLTTSIDEDWGALQCQTDALGCGLLCPPCPYVPNTGVGAGPLKQIDPFFYTPVKLNAIWQGP